MRMNASVLLAVLIGVLIGLPGVCMAQGFSDDFESYTPNEDVPSPWADWLTGLPPASGNPAVYWTLYNAYGNNNSLTYLEMGAEPVRWFDNPYDAKDRIVDVTFYVKYIAPSQDHGATFHFYGGSMGWTPNASPMMQYNVNIGVLDVYPVRDSETQEIIRHDVRYADQVDSTNFVDDGETWNEIKIRTILRNVGSMMGEGELFVNGVGTGMTYIWNLDDAMGFTGVDFGWDSESGYFIDDMSVLQNGFADPIDIPVPDYSYPGSTITSPGIECDRTNYVYMLGGANTAGTGSSELWRLDLITGSWTQLPSSPTVPVPAPGSGVIQGQACRLALTTAGDQGKISIAKSLQTGLDKSPWCIDYDIATNTWSDSINPSDTPDSWDGFDNATGAGDKLYAPGNPSQSGMLIYDAENRLFQGWQGAGNTFVFQMVGNDLAYADNGEDWLYGLGYRDRDPDPEVLDAITTIGRYDITQATPGAWDSTGSGYWYSDAPVAFPNPRQGTYYPPGHHGLTYVPEGIDSLVVLHTEWGETGLYKIPVEGGALFAVVYENNDVFRYDIATDTWTTMTDALPFVFDAQDDITCGVPEVEPVLAIERLDASNAQLSWDSLDTFRYKLWESTDLSSWTLSEDWQSGTGGTMMVTKSTTGVTMKLYKLEYEPL